MAKSDSVFGGLDPTIYQTSLSTEIFPDIKSLRAEYSRLAKAARKRIKRLEREYSESAIYRRYSKQFKPMDRKATESQLRKALAETAYYLSLETSSATGQKRARSRFVETMQEQGYDFINKSNAAAFGRFMASAQKYYGSKKAFDSEQVLEDFEAMWEEHKATGAELYESYEAWLEREE